MRDILFRGKRVDNGEWVYGYYICKQDPLPPRIDTNIIVTFDENSMSVWNKVDPETIGQYTGLQDKNGNKIFEGDILELYDQFVKYRGIVEFRHSAFIIKYGNRMTTLYEIERQNNFHSGLWNLNVIGNIYDNPEMLVKGGD